MGRRSMGRYQNGNGQSYQDDLPERGPGATKSIPLESEQVARGCDIAHVLSKRNEQNRKVLHRKKCLRDDDVSINCNIFFSFVIAVESLIYWRDVKKSGVVFGIGLAILLAMSMFSLISVFAYLSLLTLVGTISFRIYKTIMSAVQKTSEGHPFK